MSHTQTNHDLRRLAAVSYLPLLGPIVLYGHSRNRFVCLHALQGTLLSVYLLLAYAVPVAGVYLALGVLAVLLSGMIHAAGGHDYRVFGLGHFLDWVLSLTLHKNSPAN
jgi:uncharacterized membrane protein